MTLLCDFHFQSSWNVLSVKPQPNSFQMVSSTHTKTRNYRSCTTRQSQLSEYSSLLVLTQCRHTQLFELSPIVGFTPNAITASPHCSPSQPLRDEGSTVHQRFSPPDNQSLYRPLCVLKKSSLRRRERFLSVRCLRSVRWLLLAAPCHIAECYCIV